MAFSVHRSVLGLSVGTSLLLFLLWHFSMRGLFNEARKVYYARKDRSSSPGAPAKKRSKPLAGFKPPDKSPDREPAEADAPPAEETAEEKEQRERATSDADHKLDALLDG